MWYDLLKRCVSIVFNLLNLLLGGKLPPFTSACVVVEENDQYLVVELPGKRIVFPGGFLQHNETPQQGAEREGYEETGLHIQVDDVINHYVFKNSTWYSMSNICFACHGKVVGGELRNNIEGKPYWLHETELYKRLGAHSRKILADYQAYRAQKRNPQEQRSTLIA
jgi:ADP-ribose pyrophosphatase YjhB (NUDIX family)